MITTNDGVVKKRGDKVWSIASLKNVSVPSLFDVHGRGSNNFDGYLEMNGCWADWNKCSEACKERDKKLSK